MAVSLTSAAAGFATALSLIMAIGAQNAFVLRQGLIGHHVPMVVAFCAASDAVLIAMGVLGADWIAGLGSGASAAMRWGGAGFLLAYGLRALVSAWRGGGGLRPAGAQSGRAATLAAVAAFT